MSTLQEMHIPVVYYTSVCTPMFIVTCPSCASALRNRRKAESLVLFNIEFHIEGCLCSLAFNTISFFCLAEQRKGRHKFMEDTFNKTQKPSVWSKIARPLHILCDTFGMWHEESPFTRRAGIQEHCKSHPRRRVAIYVKTCWSLSVKRLAICPDWVFWRRKNKHKSTTKFLKKRKSEKIPIC